MSYKTVLYITIFSKSNSDSFDSVDVSESSRHGIMSGVISNYSYNAKFLNSYINNALIWLSLI